MNWKKNKAPIIDIGKCTDCESCIEVAPNIFQRNRDTDFIEVVDLSKYPEEDILKAMSVCPVDCITWDEI